MNRPKKLIVLSAAFAMLFVSRGALAQNWSQWRGANRDAKVTDFKAPATWPKELTQKWKITVGDGVASPSLVGDRLYVFSRQGDNSVLRCLDANSNSEIWSDKFETPAFTGSAADFQGPRASPTVVDGKVVVLDARGVLVCYDAVTGKKLWSKDEYPGSVPRFYASSSPIVVNGLCIAQLGGDRGGGMIAYDLATGDEKWKWSGDGPAYSSPSLLNVDGTKAVVAVTATKLVAIDAADGKQLWQTNYTQGRYNSATPIVDGQTVIYAGPTSGITAVKMEKEGDGLAAKPLWKNAGASVQFNTPVLRDGKLFGLSNLNAVFCMTSDNAEGVAWSSPLTGQPAAAPAGGQPAEAQGGAPPQGGPPGGGRGPGGRAGRGGGGQGYGSVVDAGSVLIALNPTGQLVFFEPNDKEYKQLASYKVAEEGTYAYPVVAGNRVYIKDRDSLTLWTIE